MLDSNTNLQQINENYRFEVRASENKTIHNAFKGILRISPNEDTNGKGVDCTFGTTQEKLQLSDSDGYLLPVNFSATTCSGCDAAHVKTDIDCVFVSDKLTSTNNIITKKLIFNNGYREGTANNVLYYKLDFPIDKNTSEEKTYDETNIKINGRKTNVNESGLQVLVGNTGNKNSFYTEDQWNDLKATVLKNKNGQIEIICGKESDEYNITVLEWLDIESKIKDEIEAIFVKRNRDVQSGAIIYHAMPFHRYWFHRCRQVLKNIEIHQNNDVGFEWEDMDRDEYQKLCEYRDKEIITPCYDNTLASIHSLSKDYLICNGKEVDLHNFPNINLRNLNLLKYSNDDSSDNSSDGDLVTVNKETHKYYQKDLLQDSTYNKTYSKLCSSSGVKCEYEELNTAYDPDVEGSKPTITKTINKIKLPNLFAIQENYPRYIRGYAETNTTNKSNTSYTSEWGLKVNNWNSDTNYDHGNGSHYHLLFARDSGGRDENIETIIADTTKSGNDSYVKDNEYDILFQNYEVTKNIDANWFKYCLNDGQDVYYAGFQPIPTAALVMDKDCWKSQYHYVDSKGVIHKVGNTQKTEVKKKINESEGAYPISRVGHASFSIQHTDKTYENVAKYFLHGINKDDITSSRKRFKWRTMTGLPIINCDKLGVGDMSRYTSVFEDIKDTNDDYYIKHNVTDVLMTSSPSITEPNRPKIKIQYEKDTKVALDDSPYPSTINLLPLIRL